MIHLIRHGETEWSLTRQHTGTTDITLTPEGERQARALRSYVRSVDAATVITSPLSRARRTCELAGASGAAVVDERTTEWNYGEAEGRTTAEIREEIPGWSVWTQPFAGGETAEAVGARADEVIDDLVRRDGPIIVFGHAHFLRILGARWCGWPAQAGKHLVLDPAGICVLGFERETRCIEHWNMHPPADPDGDHAP